MRHLWARLLVVAVAGATLFCLPINAERANAAGPKLQLKLLNAHLEHGQHLDFDYTVSGVGAAPMIFLQRTFGTAHVWKSVVRLSHLAGSAEAPTAPQGVYKYRLHVANKGRVWTSPVESAYFYGHVSLLAICNSYKLQNNNMTCGTGTEQVGGKDYAYAANDAFNVQYPNYTLSMQANSTTCRRAVITFAGQTNGGYDVYLQMIQSRSDPESAIASKNAIGTFRAALDGGAWILNMSQDSGGYVEVYMNGYFDCYSPTGF